MTTVVLRLRPSCNTRRTRWHTPCFAGLGGGTTNPSSLQHPVVLRGHRGLHRFQVRQLRVRGQPNTGRKHSRTLRHAYAAVLLRGTMRGGTATLPQHTSIPLKSLATKCNKTSMEFWVKGFGLQRGNAAGTARRGHLPILKLLCPLKSSYPQKLRFKPQSVHVRFI